MSFAGRSGGRAGRRLSVEEAELWARLAATVTPLARRRVAPAPAPVPVVVAEPAPEPAPKRVKGRVPPPLLPKPVPPVPRTPPKNGLEPGGLDGSWDKRLAKGGVDPDFTLDLHGCTLDQAHARLDHGLTLALAQGARVVLLITGRLRPAPSAMDRAGQRGAIRAKFMDWLALGSHSGKIAAVRPAHVRHGGAGAVYIVLRRGR